MKQKDLFAYLRAEALVVHPGRMEFTTFPSKVTLCMMRNAVVGGSMQSDE